ncbi:MAG: thiamine phosphate synthase [Sneathiella sp.]|nr:thiamine phosphate synthase [Sneathiella sp.]
MTLPAFFYFTDDKRGRDPLEMAAGLSPDVAVLLRHYDHPSRELLAKEIKKITKKRGLTLFVAKNAALATKVKADGCHIPTHMISTLPRLKSRYPNLIFSVACHSVRDLIEAEKLGADFAFLSPLYPSRSHLGARALCLLNAAPYVQKSRIPVLGLGGVNWRRSKQLSSLGFSGLGAIDLFERLV